MQSEESWNHIIKKLDLHGDTSITFNEFLKLLETESQFRDIMFEYQLFFKSTKRLGFSKELHLTNRRQGQYGEQGTKGIPNSLQAAHIIDNIVLFESNNTHLMICGFENKDVHAIDYVTGDIVHEFIFKDESIPTQQELDIAAQNQKSKTMKKPLNSQALMSSASGKSLNKNAS